MARIAVTDVVDGALLLASAKLRHGSVRVVTDIPADLPAIRCNQVLLEQVLINLISNTCDAYESTSPSIDPGRRVFRLTAAVIDGHVLMRTADQAGGIPVEVLSRIFEPFFTTKPANKGTGVGLSFSYGIVNDLGGSMRAFNADGGAVFELALPINEQREAAA